MILLSKSRLSDLLNEVGHRAVDKCANYALPILAI